MSMKRTGRPSLPFLTAPRITCIHHSVAVGPWVDYLGPKTSMAALLLVGAVPFAFVPLVHSFAGLVTIRLVRLLAPLPRDFSSS